MKNLAARILKNVALFLTWFFISPLYLFLSIKWKIPKTIARTIFFILSPFTLILLAIPSYFAYDYYYHFIKRGSISEIEKKSHVEFPDYKTLVSKHYLYHDEAETSNRGMFHDFTIQYTIELDSTEIEKFYQNIEAQISHQKLKYFHVNGFPTGYWSKNGKFYIFSDLRGAGFGSLEFQINKKSRIVEIEYGCYYSCL